MSKAQATTLSLNKSSRGDAGNGVAFHYRKGEIYHEKIFISIGGNGSADDWLR